MRKNIVQWMKKVKATQEEEIDCSACLDQVSAYVELELAEGAEVLPAAEITPAAEKLPAVKQHLDQCAVCHEEYELLRHLARLDAQEDLPSAEALAERLKRLDQ